jgi:hypothetical protein
MNKREFDRRIKALGTRSRALPAARAVLVDGVSQNAAARELEVDVGQLNRLVTRIRAVQICECCGQAIVTD